MSPGSTDLAVVPTSHFESNDSNYYNKISDKASVTENAWNNDIEVDGDYTMVATAKDFSILIEDRSSAKKARNSALDYIVTHTNLGTTFDSVLVVDGAYRYSDFQGSAFLGDDSSGGLAAGSGKYTSHDNRFVALVGSNMSTGLEAHEVGHLYDGDHGEHRNYGLAEFTIMGNPGDTTCKGNETSDTRVRTDVFHSCATNSIRNYLDYWGSNGISFG